MNFYVEATIGAGKSTLLRNMVEVLKEQHDVVAHAVLEPVNEWVSTPAGNILSLFGADQHGYSFPTQVLIMSTMSSQRANPTMSEVTLYERSLESAKLIFQKTLADDGFLPPLQNHILDKLYIALKPGAPPVDGIIYIKVNFCVIAISSLTSFRRWLFIFHQHVKLF